MFYLGTDHSHASVPHFVSDKATPTLLQSSSYSDPFECHSNLDWMQRVERPLPTGHFFGRGLLYLHLEVGTRRSAIHVSLEPLPAICYGTPRLA